MFNTALLCRKSNVRVERPLENLLVRQTLSPCWFEHAWYQSAFHKWGKQCTGLLWGVEGKLSTPVNKHFIYTMLLQNILCGRNVRDSFAENIPSCKATVHKWTSKFLSTGSMTDT